MPAGFSGDWAHLKILTKPSSKRGWLFCVRSPPRFSAPFLVSTIYLSLTQSLEKEVVSKRLGRILNDLQFATQRRGTMGWGDRRFESLSLQQRVICELDSLACSARRPMSRARSQAISFRQRDDRDHRTGHIIGRVGGKEFHDLGAILDRSETP